MVKTVYWYWESAFSDSLVNLLLSEVDQTKKEHGLVYDQLVDSEITSDDIRKVEIVHEEYFRPIGSLLHTRALIANQSAGWNFTLTNQEDTQICFYKKGDHFKFHIDNINDDGGYCRKISTILFLNNPHQYGGGELVLENPNKDSDYISLKLPKGSIVCFPSFVKHQVNEVTSGERISAITWMHGPSFK